MITFKKIYGKNCPACIRLDSYLANLKEPIIIESYDIDSLEGNLLAAEVNAMGLPVLIKYDDNKIVGKMIGFNPSFLCGMLR